MVLPAQLVENGAANAGDSECAEGEAAGGVECLEGAHEAEGSCTHQFVEVRFGGEAARKLARHMVK